MRRRSFRRSFRGRRTFRRRRRSSSSRRPSRIRIGYRM